MVSIWVDGEWYHRVKLPFLGHPRDTKRRYSLISHLEEWWDDKLNCWVNDLGDEDHCADLRAVWHPTDERYTIPDPLFWTRWPGEWVCPPSWFERVCTGEGTWRTEPPDIPEWLNKSLSEIPPCFLLDCFSGGRKKKLLAMTPEQRKLMINSIK